MRISVANSERSFSADAGRSILDSALQAGLRLPHSCKGGNCGSCRARLLAGTISYPAGAPLGLSAAEVADGYILLCRAHALEDVRLETFEVVTPEEALVKRLPARIARLELLAHDVMALTLRLPAAENFVFRAGQYLDVLLTGGRRRSYSIASPPPLTMAGAAAPIELHVRRVAGGEFSERLFTTARAGDLLNIEGPLGRFAYEPSGASLLMIGGGTGIAPLLSMLRQAAAVASRRPLAVFWGVRSARDLYAHDTLLALTRALPQLRYTPVLCEPDDRWEGARGWVPAVALADAGDLSAVQIYTAGPPAMIAAVREEIARRRVVPAALFCDAFDYAVDPPVPRGSA